MTEYERMIKEAIEDLTEITTAQAQLIRELQNRVTYLEKYAKKRRPTVVDGFGDIFSSVLRGI